MARTWQQELHHNAKKRAKRKGIVFTILKEEIHIPSYCPLLGIPLMKNPNGRYQWDNSATIDKIDNNKGYVVGNVWVVSSLANLIMSSATAEQIIAVGEGLKAKQTEMAMKYTEEQADALEALLFSICPSVYVFQEGDISIASPIKSYKLIAVTKTVEQFDKDNGIER
tara:strand:- start:2064 stop:2567 length:504 start_codon:yes stop_codon:yes gene_type:complete